MAAAIEQMTVGIDEITRHASDAQDQSQQSGQLVVGRAGGGATLGARDGRIAATVNRSHRA